MIKIYIEIAYFPETAAYFPYWPSAGLGITADYGAITEPVAKSRGQAPIRELKTKTKTSRAFSATGKRTQLITYAKIAQASYT